MLSNRCNAACEITIRNLQEYLSSNLRILRLREGLSQEQVCEIAMISRNTYSRIESSKTMPDLQTMCLLANFYQVGLDLLVGTDLRTSFQEN